MGHNDVTVIDLEALPSGTSAIAEVAADVMSAYGELAKGFIRAMVIRCMKRGQPMMEDFWLAVGDIVFADDPEPTAGCPTEIAETIRLH